MRSRVRRAVIVAVALASAASTGVRAQEPALDVVEELAAWGRADEAREALAEWFDASMPSATRMDVQRGIWLRARLTVDPAQASRDFRRLMVEYPGGSFTERAIYRLALAAHASGDAAAVERYREALARDYPGSAVQEEAEAWLTGAPVARALSVPPRGQLDSVAAREAAPPVVVDPPTRDSVPSRPAASRPDPTLVLYAVQLGAFSSADRAEALQARAEEAGLDARIVRVQGSTLLHVRVGTFDSSGDASVFFRQVRDRGFAAAVVRDAHREEPVGE